MLFFSPTNAYGGTMSLGEYQMLNLAQFTAVLKTNENWVCPGTEGPTEGSTLLITPDTPVEVQEGALTIDWIAIVQEFKFTEIRQISESEIELWHTAGDETNRRSRCTLKLKSVSFAHIEHLRKLEKDRVARAEKARQAALRAEQERTETVQTLTERYVGKQLTEIQLDRQHLLLTFDDGSTMSVSSRSMYVVQDEPDVLSIEIDGVDTFDFPEDIDI